MDKYVEVNAHSGRPLSQKLKLKKMYKQLIDKTTWMNLKNVLNEGSIPIT